MGKGEKKHFADRSHKKNQINFITTMS